MTDQRKKIKRNQSNILQFYKYIAAVCILAGVVLMGINVVGSMISPPRHPNANQQPPAREVIKQLEQLTPTVGDGAFAKQVTTLIFKGIKHSWPINSSQLQLPFYKNWLLKIIPFLLPPISNGIRNKREKIKKVIRYYEYLDYKDAIFRGVGLCSQHAMAVTNFMIRHGFHSETILLNGHVVNQTSFPDGNTYLLDADYGVTMPFNLEFAKKHSQAVEQIYENAHYSKSIAYRISQIYTHRGKPYRKVIRNLVFLNWIIPLLSLLFGTCLVITIKKAQ